tara:strand:- start:2267 stop:3340 length:1074 start_codon:yes stop_codon:yes gene_type:complete
MKYLWLIFFMACSTIHAMPTFDLNQSYLTNRAHQIIEKDLSVTSVAFERGIIHLGIIKDESGSSRLSCELTHNGEIKLDRRYGFRSGEMLWAAHRCSDAIMNRLTGRTGEFSNRLAIIFPSHPTIVYESDVHCNRFDQLFNAHVPVIGATWSSNSRKIAYITKDQNHYELKVYDRINDEHRLLLESEQPLSSPSWSNKDRELYFTQFTHGEPKLMSWRYRRKNQLTFGNDIDLMPFGTKEGVMYVSVNGDNTDLYMINAEGSKNRILHSDGKILYPQMVDQSIYYIYDHNDAKSLIRFDLATKKQVTLLNNNNLKAFTATPIGPLVASDGKVMLLDSNGHSRWSKPISATWLSMPVN